jgi:hypothetical protein
VIPVALLLFAGLANAGATIAFTPTAFVYMPIILRQPTPTPTPTPTPLPTPTPTATPTCPYLGHVLTGQVTLDENKPSYAVGENIFFHETIANPTNSRICYGLVGVAVTKLSGSGSSFFHTSWSGDLWLDPGCTGPTDHCGGPWGDSLQIGVAGTYSFTLAVCYSRVDVCPTAGDWQTFNTLSPITVIVWPPQGPASAPGEHGLFGECYLALNDADNVQMVCP